MALTTSVALSVHRDSAQVEPRLPSTCVEWPGTSRPAPWHQWSPSDWGWWLQPGLALTVPHPDGGRISLAPSGRSQQGLGSWLEAQFTLLGPPPDPPQRRLGSLSHLQSVFEEDAPLSQSPEAPLTLPSRQTVDHEGHSLVHGETHEAPAQAPGPLLLQGLAPQEGDGRLELAGEGQARLQGTVVRPQVGVPVPVACGEGSPWGQCPAEVPYGRGTSPPSEPLRDLGNLGWGPPPQQQKVPCVSPSEQMPCQHSSFRTSRLGRLGRGLTKGKQVLNPDLALATPHPLPQVQCQRSWHHSPAFVADLVSGQPGESGKQWLGKQEV